LNKQQIILVSSGVLLFCVIYFFGRTIPPKKNVDGAIAATDSNAVTINNILDASRSQLPASQQTFLLQLEAAVVRGDVKDQQIKVFKQLASFWKDSAHLLLPAAWYTGQAAKLENSEKNLTFAARLFLDGVRRQENTVLKKWMAEQAKELFEKVLVINPANDSAKVELGSCYIFGGIGETPMDGIKMIRDVADKNPANAYAQYTLALGSLMSGQSEKAIERLLKVVQYEPNNVDASLLLADTYEQKGDKTNAVKWYEVCKKLIDEPGFKKDIDERINSLKK
jgi:tetratricopeptide (TPR) repeat protein